jgi:excisionase family DNA binding protein
MTTATTFTNLLTLEQAAERLGTSVRFIRRLRHERRLTFIKIGKHLRIDNADLETYIASCRDEVEP